MGVMEPDLVLTLRDLDPVVLGRRVKAARVGAGLTQSQLAGGDASVAYVSRIESGQRRPDAKLLEMLAARLGSPVEALVLGAASTTVAELRLSLDYAELALESGNAVDALDKATRACDDLVTLSIPELASRARFLRARALEATGDFDGAIIELEVLARDGKAHLAWVKVMIALCRCYRECGDLGRAIETGERAVARLEAVGLGQCDEVIQLTVTLAGAYAVRGDVAHAARICHKAIGDAEEAGSPAGRAAAYWNASVMESMRNGSTQAAISLAARALELLGQTNDTRNRARLRSTLGMFQLDAEPSELDAAKYNLRTALDELAWSSASPLDVGHTKIALARAHLLDGETAEAHRLLAEARALGQEQAPLLVAESRSLAGQIALADGDTATAQYEFSGAVAALTAIGADRSAAQLWFDLGGLLDQVGDHDAARVAYRRAAASTGLNPTRQPVVKPRTSSPAGAGQALVD